MSINANSTEVIIGAMRAGEIIYPSGPPVVFELHERKVFDFSTEVDTYFLYEVEMVINGVWEKENRYYKSQKSLSDFDLQDVDGKRRNAAFVGVVNKLPNKN